MELPACTLEQLMSWNPCSRYSEARIRRLAKGRETFTAVDVLKLRIPAEDRLWVVLRPELLPERTLRLFACSCAEHVLPLFEQQYPEDKRPRRAIETARRFAAGEAPREELAAAGDDAWAAAGIEAFVANAIGTGIKPLCIGAAFRAIRAAAICRQILVYVTSGDLGLHRLPQLCLAIPCGQKGGANLISR
jgi:hypothetical protein